MPPLFFPQRILMMRVVTCKMQHTRNTYLRTTDEKEKRKGCSSGMCMEWKNKPPKDGEEEDGNEDDDETRREKCSLSKRRDG